MAKQNHPYGIVVDKEKTKDLTYDIYTKKFNWDITMEQFARYMMGIYSNYDRFKSRYLDEKINTVKNDDYLQACIESGEIAINGEVLTGVYEGIMQYLYDLGEACKTAKGFEYSEVFEIKDSNFQALVWTSVDISQMVHQLGGKKIKSDGIEVVHKIFSKEGKFLGTEKKTCLYDIFEADANKLYKGFGTNNIYAVRCWCTTTNKEHYIWIEEQYKDDPLTAIASTFRIHEKLKPYIKELKRQGDILLVELTEEGESIVVDKDDPMIPLTKEEYFGFLTAQS